MFIICSTKNAIKQITGEKIAMEHEEIGSGFDVSNVGIHHDKPETMSLCDLNTGKVYTPRFLADWVASVLLENIKVINKTSVLDPACGEGELLLSIKNKSKKKLHLCGVDIDPNAVNNAAMKFETEGVFIASDAIIPDKNKPVISSWTEMLRNRKFDGVIANPPWGAHIFHSRKELIEAGYTLSKGQFDTWELFIELSLKIVKRCGVLAFIIPGAIFLPEHQPLRKLLQERTTILMIARLGEGLFQKIYRGTTVILVKNECPKKITLSRHLDSTKIGELKFYPHQKHLMLHGKPFVIMFRNNVFGMMNIFAGTSTLPKVNGQQWRLFLRQLANGQNGWSVGEVLSYQKTE